MDSLWTLVILPLTLYAAKLLIDRKAKKKDAELEEKRTEEKEKWQSVSSILESLQEMDKTLIKKIDIVEDLLKEKEDLETSRNKIKELWEHFRSEIEGLKEKMGEIRGELRAKRDR